jgi:hypothetical protein
VHRDFFFDHPVYILYYILAYIQHKWDVSLEKITIIYRRFDRFALLYTLTAIAKNVKFNSIIAETEILFNRGSMICHNDLNRMLVHCVPHWATDGVGEVGGGERDCLSLEDNTPQFPVYEC